MPDRRDQKGRVLREGESQRKDGQYMYRYTDFNGTRQTIYSWTLVKTDKVPKGKRAKEPLRDLEAKIRRDIEDGIIASDTTVSQAFYEWMELRPYIKANTQSGYYWFYENVIDPVLGDMKLTALKYTTIKRFYLQLIEEKHYSAGTLSRVNTILKQICDQAVRDNILRTSPVADAYKVVANANILKPRPKRTALSASQQNALVEYMKTANNGKRYVNLITVLLGTGMRIGEAIGLRVCDCDFEQDLISVNHALIYRNFHNEQYKFLITTPKTKAGNRMIPMFAEVKSALLKEIAAHTDEQRAQCQVDGYKDFIFLNSRGRCRHPIHVTEALSRMEHEYNVQEQAAATVEHREPTLLPHLSPHILRHTFCTRLCEQKENIKVIQYVMGHKNIAMTLDVYADATEEHVIDNFQKLEGKIKLA